MNHKRVWHIDLCHTLFLREAMSSRRLRTCQHGSLTSAPLTVVFKKGVHQ